MFENKEHDWLSNLVKKYEKRLVNKKVIGFKILVNAVMEAAIFMSERCHNHLIKYEKKKKKKKK